MEEIRAEQAQSGDYGDNTKDPQLKHHLTFRNVLRSCKMPKIFKLCEKLLQSVCSTKQTQILAAFACSSSAN